MIIADRLEILDKKLAAKAIRIPYRSLAAFKQIYGSVVDEAKRIALMEPISRWYGEKYGDRANWDMVIATFPVVVRGELFSSKARCPVGDELINYKDVIEGLPEDIKLKLDEADFNLIAERMQQANLNWRFIYNLTVDNSNLPQRAQELVERGIHDLENAGNTLSNTQDLHTGMVHSHEAAEKFIKAALIYAGFKGNVENLRHKLDHAYQVLAKLNTRYSAMPKPTAALSAQVPNMQLRYGPSEKNVNDAVSAYQASLYICGTLARMWSLDLLRGTQNSDFEPASFYETPIGSFAYCKTVVGDDVTLLNFRPIADRFLRFDMRLSQRESSLYLKVTDAAQDLKLRNELMWYLRECQRKVPPSESNISIVSSDEGSFAVSRMKLKLSGNLSSSSKP